MNLPQSSIFDLDAGRDPDLESWSQVVDRRMRALLMAGPVHQMAANAESGHHPEWQGQNFTFLALQVFDSVFARMAPGIGQGATREQIIADLSPLIFDRNPSLNDDQAVEIIDYILAWLMNDNHGPFERECVRVESGQIVKPYPFRFSLLKAYHDTLSDKFIIRATTEAIHLYLRMLDQPLQDEQIANLVILQEQVRRGRITQARQEAERTKLLSIGYERQIEDMLRTVRRDVRMIDWIAEVQPKIEEAHEHVQGLIRNQGKVLGELKSELQRGQDTNRLRAIHDLIALLEQCQRRHMELEKRILAAGPVFLEEQSYQRFRSMARSPLPDLNERIFLPALRLPAQYLRPHLNQIYSTVLGPRIHRILDIGILIDRLLRDETPAECAPHPEDLEERTAVGELFNPVRDESDERIASILQKIDSRPVRLGRILEIGRRAELDSHELGMLGVTLLQSYHARSDLLGLRVLCDGQQLDDPEFSGDDLIVSRRNSDDEI